MSAWSPLRRARDSIRPNRPVSKFPEVVSIILDEIKELKKEIKKLKNR